MMPADPEREAEGRRLLRRTVIRSVVLLALIVVNAVIVRPRLPRAADGWISLLLLVLVVVGVVRSGRMARAYRRRQTSGESFGSR